MYKDETWRIDISRLIMANLLQSRLISKFWYKKEVKDGINYRKNGTIIGNILKISDKKFIELEGFGN